MARLTDIRLGAPGQHARGDQRRQRPPPRSQPRGDLTQILYLRFVRIDYGMHDSSCVGTASVRLRTSASGVLLL